MRAVGPGVGPPLHGLGDGPCVAGHPHLVGHVEPPVALLGFEPCGSARAGRRHDVDGDRVSVGATCREPTLVDQQTRGSHALGRGAARQEGAVSDLVGQSQRPWSGRSGGERGRGRRRPVQLHTVQRDVAAGSRHSFAVEQRPQGRRVLPQQSDGGLDARADLARPVLDPVAEGRGEASGEQPVQRGDLHRGERDVAQRHRGSSCARPGARGRAVHGCRWVVDQDPGRVELRPLLRGRRGRLDACLQEVLRRFL